jgi:hypothetical protein
VKLHTEHKCVQGRGRVSLTKIRRESRSQDPKFTGLTGNRLKVEAFDT